MFVKVNSDRKKFKKRNDPADLNEKGISVRCRISKYLLQIVRCNNSKCCGNFQTAWKSVLSSCFLPAPIPVRQIPEGRTLPCVSDVKASDGFVDFWKRIGIQQLIPNSGFSRMPYDLYCPSLKAKVRNVVCKQCGVYYPSIVARKRHRHDGFGLEVLGNKVIDEEEDITHEKEENFEILVADGDDYHALVINIYELLLNSEFIEVQTDRDS